MQRVRVGLTGLACVFLLVMLATAFLGGGREGPTANQTSMAVANGSEQPSEPLAQLGVAPGNNPPADPAPPAKGSARRR